MSKIEKRWVNLSHQSGITAGDIFYNESKSVKQAIDTIQLEQGTGFIDSDYLYTVYGEDDNWEVIRNTRDLSETKTTGIETGTKPTTLEDVQDLTYN